MASRNLRGDLEQRAMQEKPNKFFKRAFAVGTLAVSLLSFTGCETPGNQVEAWQIPGRLVGGIIGDAVRGGVSGYNAGNSSQSQVPPGGSANFYIGVWNDKNFNGKLDYGETEKRAFALSTEKAGAFIESTIQGYFTAYYDVVDGQGRRIKEGNLQSTPGRDGFPSVKGFTFDAPIGKYTINWRSPTGNIISSFNLKIVDSMSEVIKQPPSDIEIITGSWTDSNGDGAAEAGEIKIGNTFQVGETVGVFFKNLTSHASDFNYEVVDSENNYHSRGSLSTQPSTFTGICSEDFLANKYTFKIFGDANGPSITKEITIVHPPNTTGDSPAYEDYLVKYQSQFFKLKEKIPSDQSVAFFLFKNYEDLNKDGLAQADEYFGFGKTFDLRQDNVKVQYCGLLDKGTNVYNFRLWNDSGKMLAETIVTNTTNVRKDFSYGLERVCDPQKRKTSNSPDIMNRLDEFGSGHYVLTATINGGQLRRAEFDLISSSLEKR